jgi:translocon-associated protein subunit alpha
MLISQIKNTTTAKYNVPLVAGANFSAPYTLNSEFRPSELGLTVWVNLAEQGSTEISHITALNQTVSVVEQPSSWLDPSLLFLWLLLGSALLGGAYAAYNTFLAPKQKKTKRTVKRAVVVNEKTEAYPNVKPYDEDWIPATHLKNRSSKTKRRDGGASSGGEEVLSAGDITSGAESGPEVSKGGKKRKGKKA